MISKWRISISLGLMVFFFIGHTVGTLTRKDVKSENSIQTIKAMETTFVELPSGSSDHTIDQFYQGMSLSLDISILIIIGLLLICLGDEQLPGKYRSRILLYVIFWTASIAIISFLFIFPVPAITCLLAAILLGIDWILKYFRPNKI